MRTGSSRTSSFGSDFSSSPRLLLHLLQFLDIRRFDDLDFHRREPRQEGLHIRRAADGIRQRFAKIIEREMPLLLGEKNQFAQLFLNFRLIDDTDRRGRGLDGFDDFAGLAIRASSPAQARSPP